MHVHFLDKMISERYKCKSVQDIRFKTHINNSFYTEFHRFGILDETKGSPAIIGCGLSERTLDET